jgi:nucleotide-binding universal stress UspA family protein
MLGSVTERVLREAPCPVLTVPPRHADAVPAGPVLYRRLLCGIDFSPASTRALAYATSLARQTGAHLTLIHVLGPQPLLEPMLAGGDGGMITPEERRQAVRARMHATAPDDVAMSEVVAEGSPYRELLSRAEVEDSDLIVIGVHEGLADRLHLGSVANHVIRGATCPVLSLRA